MRIELYKSALCPRCAYVANILKKLQAKDKSIHVKTYDLATNLKAFKEANVKMIPCIKINGEKRSWMLPKEKEIKEFLAKHS